MVFTFQIGSGTFTVTDGYTVAEPIVTVTVIESFCGSGALRMGDLAVMDQLAANLSSPSTSAGPNYMIDADLRNGTIDDNSTHSSNKTSLTAPYTFPNSTLTNGTLANSTRTNTTDNECDEFAIAGCRQCCNSAGICCPLEVPCDAKGKCPGSAIEAMGYLRGGLNMVMARNGSDGSQGIDDSVDPRELGYIGVDADGDEMAARFGPGGTFGDGSANSEQRFGDDHVNSDEGDSSAESKRDIKDSGSAYLQRRDITDEERILMRREQEREERVRKQKELIKRLNAESARQRREGIGGPRLSQRGVLAGYGAMEMDWDGRGMDRRGNGMLVAGDVAGNAWE
jgi:hypothetical protein